MPVPPCLKGSITSLSLIIQHNHNGSVCIGYLACEVYSPREGVCLVLVRRNWWVTFYFKCVDAYKFSNSVYLILQNYSFYKIVMLTC